MELATMHPEDVKAGLRKRFGTVFAFEREYGLPNKSVVDFLRGRLSTRVKEAIEDALSKPTPQATESDLSDCSPVDTESHRLNVAAR